MTSVLKTASGNVEGFSLFGARSKHLRTKLLGGGFLHAIKNKKIIKKSKKRNFSHLSRAPTDFSIIFALSFHNIFFFSLSREIAGGFVGRRQKKFLRALLGFFNFLEGQEEIFYFFFRAVRFLGGGASLTPLLL